MSALCGFRTCQTFGPGPLVAYSLLLSALSLCPWCVVFEYGSISRFKGVFSGFWAFRVGLCFLRALRGLCGFCTRVELGGFMACGVFAFLLSFCLSPFAFRFISLLQLFVLRLVCFVMVVFLCPLALSLWLFRCGCCFLFPFGLHAKRKGAISCVLSCPVVGLLCKIWFSVLVKFVIVSVNLFGYIFIREREFVIVLPLLEKTFENTINEFPCVKLVFYALLYVV